MSNFDSIADQAFSSTPHIVVQELVDESRIPWEKWVRKHLGSYLDVLPYGRIVLSEYIKPFVVLAVSESEKDREIDSKKESPIVSAFMTLLVESFPLNTDVTVETVKTYLKESSHFGQELRAIGLVYAYHIRRSLGKAESGESMWDSVEEPKPEPLKIDIMNTLIKEQTRERTRTERKTEFLNQFRHIMRNILKWDPNTQKDALQKLENMWKKLDSYSKKDVEFMYEFVRTTYKISK